MKKILFFLFILLIPLNAVALPRKKVAVVLSGGGAKGVAHIGALKVLEEAGIPIDYVVGTSMGAIVGGLYAIGYDAAALDSMVNNQDWRFLLSDDVQRSDQSFPQKESSEMYILSLPFGKDKKDRNIPGVIKGQNLFNLFSNLTIGYHDSVDFNKLNIPFACVAVDVVTGKEHVFRQGSLPLAMRASMAIPAVFTPVKLDSMVLIDGGLNNNYPVDIAQEMGADIIIGVDLLPGKLKTAESLSMATDLIAQIVALHSYNKYQQNLDHTDLLIRPDLASYTSASFSKQALDSMIYRGERAARQQWDELVKLKEKIGVIEDDKPCESNLVLPVAEADTFFIRNISFIGINPRDEKWLKHILEIQENSNVTLKQLRKGMSTLFGTNAYSDISYKLTDGDEHDLILSVQQKSITSLNLGLRFDTEEIVSVLLNATLDYRSLYNSRVAVTGRIGQNSYGRIDYAIEKNPLRNFNLAYMFNYNDLNIYDFSKKTFNTSYQRHLFEFGYTDVNWLNFKFQVGVRYEYYNFNSILYNSDNRSLQIDQNRFTSTFAVAHLETLDKRYFPTKGVSLKADYSFYLDDFIGNKINSVFSSVGLDFTSVLPITSRFSVLPSLYGRVIMGKPLYPYMNVVGGESFGRYLPHQLPFAGINHLEIFDNSVVIAKLHLRQRIGQKHYLSLIGNYALQHDKFFQLLDGKNVWGGSIGYAYNSIAGPISANFSFSNHTVNKHVKPLFYMSLGYYF